MKTLFTSLALLFACAVSFGDTDNKGNPASLWRDGDRLGPPVSRDALAVVPGDSSGRAVRVMVDLFGTDKTADVIIFERGDTLSCVQDATRHIFLFSCDTLSYLGFENRATKLLLDSPLIVLKTPLADGATVSSSWSGSVGHRGRTLLRKVLGSSTTLTENGWSMTADGDTLKGLTRIRWELAMRYAHPDSLGTEIPDTVVSPSVSDMMLPSRRLLSESLLTCRDIWLSTSARYPVLVRSDVFSILSDGKAASDTVPISCLAMRYPADLQRIDTGEETVLRGDDSREPVLTPYGEGSENGDFPVQLKNPEVAAGSVSVTLSSQNGNTRASLTLFSAAGIPLSETLTVEAGEIPQTYTIHAYAGTTGVVLLRIDAGDLSRTYRTIL